jgi:cytochrome b involved in lipid metabolism
MFIKRRHILNYLNIQRFKCLKEYKMNTYTREEIESHNKRDDLRIIIDHKVYDVSEFANIHPGGKHLLYSVGGQDATEYFYELHRESILHEVGDDFIIGNLVSSKL